MTPFVTIENGHIAIYNGKTDDEPTVTFAHTDEDELKAFFAKHQECPHVHIGQTPVHG